MIEFDVRRTRDGELISFHDGEIAGVGVPVATLTRSEIESLAGVLPPLLEEVLELALGRIALDVELKEDGYVDELVDLLLGFAANGGDLIVSSFLDRVIAQLTEVSLQIPRGLVIAHSRERAPERAQRCGAGISSSRRCRS